MKYKKQILGINGSASRHSSNQTLLNFIQKQDLFELEIIEDLSTLPHFQTALTNENVPDAIVAFRAKIAAADGIIISSPEYVFSIPSGLKNAIEWCVSTTVFSDKPLGIITASASGVKAKEELELIMKTVQTKFNNDTSILIQGIKGKVNTAREITHAETRQELLQFLEAFDKLTDHNSSRLNS